MNEQATKNEIMLKFLEMLTEFERIDGEIKERQKLQEVLIEQGKDAIAAGRLFGFDVLEEAKTFRLPDTHEVPRQISMPSKKSVKEMILDEMKKAYPEPIRAVRIQEILEAHRGEKLHYKTVGMTLYRLSKEGLVTRSGWDWFYVPTQKNETSTAATVEASSGPKSGLFD